MAKKQKTVAFHQLCVDGPSAKFAEVDWDQFLTGLGDRKEDDRRVDVGDDHFLVEVRHQLGRPHLVLHRFKSDTDWMHVFSSQGIQEWSTKQGALLDTSVVSFIGFGSVFGHVLGSVSAPRASDVAAVLSTFFLNHFVAVPVVAQQNTDSLLGVNEVTQFDLQVMAGTGLAPDARHGVTRAINQLCNSLDPNVTVTISVSAGNLRDPKTLQKNHDEASRIMLGGSRSRLKRGSAKIVTDAGQTDLVHAVEYDLAFRVPIGGGDEKVAVDDACGKIVATAIAKEDLLRRAVNIPKV